jgi:signal peptidase
VVVPFVGTVVEGVGGSVGWVQRRLAALFGTRALLGTQGLSYVLVGFGVVTYLLSAVFEGSGDRDTRRRTRRSTGVLNFRTIVVVMLVALVAILTLSMALPAGTQSFQFVSSETDAPGPSVIPQGGSETVTYNVPSNGQVPVVSIVEPASDGVSLNRSVLFVPGGGVQRVTVTLEAPAETGAYNRIIVEHRYLAFLPVGVIVFLHGLHPWLPVVAINAVAGTLFVALAVVLVGTDPIRIERGKRDVPLSIRLRRWLD